MKRRVLLVTILAIAISPMDQLARLSASSADPGSSDQTSGSEPLAIVVNRSNALDDLTSSELRDIFLGARSHWPNGRRITLVMREPGDPERHAILRNVCGMTEEQFTTHFVRGLYRGDILVSPKILSSATGVRRFIFNVPGAIGYLRLSEIDDSVKELRIDERRPEEKGYRIRITNLTGN